VNFLYNEPWHPHHATATSNNMVLTYDVAGNLSTYYENEPNGFSRVFSYNRDGRLSIVRDSDNGATGIVDVRHVYDPAGSQAMRVATTNDWQTFTTTVYLSNFYEKIGSEFKKYIYLGGIRIAEWRSDGTKYFYVGDHLNGLNVVTNEAKQVVQRLEYKPYGGASQTMSANFPASFQFAGNWKDPLSGLYNYGARFYYPELGRFVSVDPAMPDPLDFRELNPYGYARGNPVSFVDIGGYRTAWPEITGIAVGIAASFIPGCAGPCAGFIGGAVSGALSARETQSDPMQGAVMGATIGAITGGIMDAAMAPPATAPASAPAAEAAPAAAVEAATDVGASVADAAAQSGGAHLTQSTSAALQRAIAAGHELTLGSGLEATVKVVAQAPRSALTTAVAGVSAAAPAITADYLARYVEAVMRANAAIQRKDYDSVTVRANTDATKAINEATPEALIEVSAEILGHIFETMLLPLGSLDLGGLDRHLVADLPGWEPAQASTFEYPDSIKEQIMELGRSRMVGEAHLVYRIEGMINGTTGMFQVEFYVPSATIGEVSRVSFTPGATRVTMPY